MEKSLYDISLKITEEEYRKDSALSYSTLATYERGGFSELPHLFDRKETPSLTLGSAVDSLITGSQEEFDERFMIAEFPKISDTMITIVKTLFNTYSDTYTRFSDIPDDTISLVAKNCDFWAGDKWDKIRAKKVKEEAGCSTYYNLLYVAQGKTVLSTDTYNDVMNMVDALHTSPATSYYFAPNIPFVNIERLYQLKFKATLDGVDYRCMSDLLIVNYDKKLVVPCDLKTTGKPEYKFYKSFIEWSYQLQSRLYWRIIRDNMDKDPYFKDFELTNYKFIVVNKTTLNPLVWSFPMTKEKGTLTFKDGTIMRDPEEIGAELSYYLEMHPKVPIGIEDDNDLCKWINKG